MQKSIVFISIYHTFFHHIILLSLFPVSKSGYYWNVEFRLEITQLTLKINAANCLTVLKYISLLRFPIGSHFTAIKILMWRQIILLELSFKNILTINFSLLPFPCFFFCGMYVARMMVLTPFSHRIKVYYRSVSNLVHSWLPWYEKNDGLKSCDKKYNTFLQ